VLAREEARIQAERERIQEEITRIKKNTFETELQILEAIAKDAANATREMVDARQRTAELQQQIRGGGLQGDIETITAEQAGLISGVTDRRILRTDKQAQLDEQFSAIFDDMIVSILTARKTVGEAFAGLAFGIVDTFAQEFSKELQKSFVTPVIQSLTNFLQEGLQDLFGGLSTKGLKGVFGGIAKGIGTIFGGFFASGGTLGPGKFGIAGERGPELIFAGNQPMHIAPVTAGSAGNVFNISVGVNAPSGTVDKRTQDQLAVTVMNAVKRAQRNEGSR
jgi:hypothetical protein